MHQYLKPSKRELQKHLREAIQAFDSGNYAEVDRHIRADMEELHLICRDDYWDLVYECLQLALEDPKKCYRNPTPRKSTKHKETMNLLMWPFEVLHSSYRKPLYFKFCLKKINDEIHYLHIDCHESRKK